MSIQSTKCNRELLDDPRRLRNDLKPCSLTHLGDLPNEYFIVCVWTVLAVTIKFTLNRTFRFFASSRCGVARSSRSGVTISTLINTGCGLSVLSLLTGLSVSQTSEAILLYALRYHTIGFDRFFSGCDLFRMLCLFTQTVCASFAACTQRSCMVTHINFQFYGRRTALTSIQVITKSDA